MRVITFRNTGEGRNFVFIDECQDLNACQRSLMLKAVKPNGGRFIAVGDPAQAIYGFAGADSDSDAPTDDTNDAVAKTHSADALQTEQLIQCA